MNTLVSRVFSLDYLCMNFWVSCSCQTPGPLRLLAVYSGRHETAQHLYFIDYWWLNNFKYFNLFLLCLCLCASMCMWIWVTRALTMMLNKIVRANNCRLEIKIHLSAGFVLYVAEFCLLFFDGFVSVCSTQVYSFVFDFELNIRKYYF